MASTRSPNEPATHMSGTQEISVRVLDDGRRAEVHIPVGCDAANLTPSLLCTIAADACVQITPEVARRLAAIVDEYKSAPRDLVADCAHALEPIPGTNGTWTWEPKFDPTAMQSASVGEQRTDHHASHVLSVVTGTRIARFTPPTDGTDGRSVTGTVIPARRGNPAIVRLGEGVEARPDGFVIAKIDGVLSVVKGVATISSVLNVKGSVDFSTGNIDFKGDVQVADAAVDGFQIRATGNVTIKGPVEGAEIVCGGDLSCPRGIASARRAKIVVGGNASIGFLRNVTAVFRGDFTCRGELEHSDVTIGGECHCETGRVVGGRLVLTGIAHIGELGSVGWSPTVVCVGDLPLVAMEVRRLGTELVRVQKAIAVKDESLRHLQSGGGTSAADREKMTELQYELSELRREATAIESQRATLQESVRQGRGTELHVARIVYPKVRLQHGDTAIEFDKEVRGPLQFLLDDRGAMFVRISTQVPRPVSEFGHAVQTTPMFDRAPVCKCA